MSARWAIRLALIGAVVLSIAVASAPSGAAADEPVPAPAQDPAMADRNQPELLESLLPRDEDAYLYTFREAVFPGQRYQNGLDPFESLVDDRYFKVALTVGFESLDQRHLGVITLMDVGDPDVLRRLDIAQWPQKRYASLSVAVHVVAEEDRKLTAVWHRGPLLVSVQVRHPVGEVAGADGLAAFAAPVFDGIVRAAPELATSPPLRPVSATAEASRIATNSMAILLTLLTMRGAIARLRDRAFFRRLLALVDRDLGKPPTPAAHLVTDVSADARGYLWASRIAASLQAVAACAGVGMIALTVALRSSGLDVRLVRLVVAAAVILVLWTTAPRLAALLTSVFTRGRFRPGSVGRRPSATRWLRAPLLVLVMGSVTRSRVCSSRSGSRSLCGDPRFRRPAR